MLLSKNLEEVKLEFKNKGYCAFPIEMFDNEFYNFIKKNFKCDDENNLQKAIYSFRFDSINLEKRYSNTEKDFFISNKEKENLYELNKHDDAYITQLWFYNCNLNDALSLLDLDLKFLDKIKVGLNKIVRFLYEMDGDTEIIHPEIQLTYYNKNCRFKPHTDGANSVHLCSMILYLNENYNTENGGLLVFNDELIAPELGICAIMDLTQHDIIHGVTPVTDGNGRYAILSFPQIVKK